MNRWILVLIVVWLLGCHLLGREAGAYIDHRNGWSDR